MSQRKQREREKSENPTQPRYFPGLTPRVRRRRALVPRTPDSSDFFVHSMPTPRNLYTELFGILPSIESPSNLPILQSMPFAPSHYNKLLSVDDNPLTMTQSESPLYSGLQVNR